MDKVTRMNVSLFGICVHTALSAELFGHKEADGNNWKDVGDEVLCYSKILSEREVLLLNDTPIGYDVEDVPFHFDGTEEIESIIRINYSNYSSDVSRFSDFQTCTWEGADSGATLEHTIVMHDSNTTMLYYNDDIETVVTTIMNLFNTVHFHDDF